MSVTTIASRYAKSLMDLCVERNELETVVKAMEALKDVISNRDFYLMLKSPIIKTEKKLSIMNAIFKGKTDPMVLAFINILTKKGRENILPEITNEFINQYKIYKRISTVKIKTAKSMDDALLNAIKSKLENTEAAMENVEIETEVDESLIGGFVLQVGDKLYDASVSHKLELLKKDFQSQDYIKNI